MSCKLVCSKGVLHKDEFLDLICMNDSCIQQGQVLNCVVCIEEEHRGHELLHITKFINLYKHQIQQLNSQLKNSGQAISINQTLNNQQEQDCINLLERLQQLQVQLSQTIQFLNDKINIIKQPKQGSQVCFPDVNAIVQNINNEDKILQLLQTVFSKIVLEKSTTQLKLRDTQLVNQVDLIPEPNNNHQEKIKQLVKQLEWAFNQYSGNLFIQTESQRFQATNSVRKETLSIGTTKKQSQTCQNFFMPERSPLSIYNQSSADNFSQSRTLSQFHSLRASSSFQLPIDRSLSSKKNVIFKYEFSQDCKADGIEISSSFRVAKLTKDLEKRLIVLQPPVYGSDITKEVEIHFRIKNLKNSNLRYPLAVGICSLQTQKQNNFIFNGCPEQMRMINTKVQNHGCYLVNAFGVVRSVNEVQDLTNAKSSMRFQSGTDLILLFKPFHQQLLIKRINEAQKQQEITTCIQLKLEQGQPLYACVRFGDLLDEVQII